MKLEFIHSMSFFGSTYSIKVDGKVVDLDCSHYDKEQKAFDKLQELGIVFNEKIVFVWDGTM